MTQTALMDRIRATSSAITSQVSGELVAWHVKASQKVGRWETLATVRDHAGIVEITSDQPGTIKALMFPTGAQIEAGTAIAYFQPDASQTRQNGHHAAIPAPAPVVSAPDRATSHSPSEPPRRGFPLAAVPVELPPVEELAIAPESGTIVPAEPIGSLAKPSKPQKRQRTRHATYHVTEAQQTGLKRLVASLTLKDVATSESELVRAALQLLLDLPEPALLALVEKNQDRERAGRYGRGYPRPGRR